VKNAEFERRYERGYDLTHLPLEVRRELKDFEKTNLLANLLQAVFTIISIPLIAGVYALTLFQLGPLELPVVILALTMLTGYGAAVALIARQQRALENMVHDASHRNWHRNNPSLNHMVANLLVAYPVLSTVEAYWKSHLIHHGKYGSHLDPCRRRFANMGLGDIDLSSRWKIIKAVVSWLPQYNREFYSEIGSLKSSVWLHWIAWHVAVFLVPMTVGLIALGGMAIWEGALTSLFIWVLFWMIPATSALTVLRSIAEAEEHDYEEGRTEFDTTNTNIGPAHWYFHPMNDKYHLVHHMFPQIPGRVAHKVHRLLMQKDPKYRSARHNTTILG
jgi:fatty acid desaturase